MRIVSTSLSGDYVRVIVHYDNKEQITAFGPFAPPLPHEPKVREPLAAIDVEVAIAEIAKQTHQPEDDVRSAVARYLTGRRFTTPADWFERFKAAGGQGRVDAEKIWFSESEPQPNAALAVIDEILGAGKEDAYRQVLKYLQERHKGFVGWADF